MQDDKQKINKVRLCADSGKFDSPKNDLTNLPISFRAGDSVCFDIVLLHNNKLVDCSNLSTIALEILDVGAPNSPLPRNPRLLVKKIVEASQVQTTLTQEEFESGGKHLSILLNSSDTALKQKYYYLKLCAFDEYGNRATFASGWILIEQVYGSEIITDKEQINFIEELEGIVNRQIARVDETLEQFDVLKCELENKADKSSTLLGYGINDTYTKAEADLKISTATQALQLFKSNSGMLHFNNGRATTGNFTLTLPFTMMMRVKFDKDSSPSGVLGLFGTGKNIAHSIATPFSLSFNFGTKIFQMFCSGYVESVSRSIGYNVSFDWDNNVHTLVWVVRKVDATDFDCDLYIDGLLQAKSRNSFDNKAYLAFDSPNDSIVGLNKDGALYSHVSNPYPCDYNDIYLLNFDASAEDAPYTLADYQQGKPIPAKCLDSSSGQRALLALENYTITNGTTKQIFDYSGNAKDATCSGTGTIKGDNDNKVQRLVDFIKA